MHKLTQLERLDLGNNEFSELVSNTPFFNGKPVCFGCSVHVALNFYLKGIIVWWPHAMVTFPCRIEDLS